MKLIFIFSSDSELSDCHLSLIYLTTIKLLFSQHLKGSWSLRVSEEMLIVGKLSQWPLCSHLLCGEVFSLHSSHLKSVKLTVHFQPYLLTAIQTRHKAQFNHFFPQVGLTFCFDKINYRSRLFSFIQPPLPNKQKDTHRYS